MSLTARWCSQCFAPSCPVTVIGPGATGSRPGQQEQPLPPPAVEPGTTRWAKTPTTFGPVGRVLATVLTLLPLVVMVVGGFVVMFSWGGAALYAGLVVPRAMRDIWRAGRRALPSPVSAPVSNAFSR